MTKISQAAPISSVAPQGAEPDGPLPAVLAALAAAGDVAYVWDVASDAIAWHGSLETLGLAEGVAVASGEAFAERINPDDLLRRQQLLHAHYARGVPFDCEYRVRLDGGRFAWLHDRGTAERDGLGRPQRVLGVVRLVTGRKTQEQRLERLANLRRSHRPLQQASGCARRSTISSRRASAPATSGAYLAVGIDKLATINDAFGVSAADQVLIEIGRRLDRCLRISDVVGRVGGDRFGVVLAHCAEQHVARRGREDPRRRQPLPIETPAGPIYATVSIGSATFPEQAKTAYEVMTRAEAALADAKRAGRDCFVPYSCPKSSAAATASAWRSARRCSARSRKAASSFAYQPVVIERHRRGRLPRMPAAHDRRGRRASSPPATSSPRSSNSASSASSTAIVLEAAVAEVADHPGFRLGINISGLTATDRAWLGP